MNVSIKSAIYQILHSKTIVDYLERKGHHPVKTLSGGKMQYLCPYPDHNEVRPSFVVYTHSEYENFHCFGCNRGHNIVHLVSGLEGISIKEATERLGSGLEINPLEGVDIEQERITKVFNSMQPFQQDVSIADAMRSLSSMSRGYIEGVNGDSTECGIIDGLFAVIDNDIKNYEFDKVFETLRHLPDILRKRRIKFEKNKIERLKSKYESEASS